MVVEGSPEEWEMNMWKSLSQTGRCTVYLCRTKCVDLPQANVGKRKLGRLSSCKIMQ
jgi:hypothetical protein